MCNDLNAFDKYERWVQVGIDWFVAPTLGYFCRGYGLMIPHEHTFSLGDLSTETLQAARFLSERIRRAFSEAFGPTILAEHGSAGTCAPGAACCDHAHLHIIPLRTGADIETLFQAYRDINSVGERRISSIEELRGVQRPYIYLSTSPDAHFVWPATGFPKQWVRIAVARILGIDTWDWRKHPFEESLREDIGAFHKLIDVSCTPKMSPF